MIKTVNKTRVTPAGGSYPYGNIKDTVGLVKGTPINNELLADYVQFFEKMFSESALVASNLPDNATNGFQLFKALEKMTPEIEFRGAKGYTAQIDLNADTNEFTTGFAYFTSLKKSIELRLSSSPGYRIVSLGDAPSGTEIFIYGDPASSSFIKFVVNGTTLGGQPVIKKNGVSASDTDVTIAANEVYHFVKFGSFWQMSLMP